MSVNEILADTFDIDLSEKQVEDTSARIQEIKKDVANQKYTLEDKEYIRAELQSLIELNRTVLETLGEQCKLGAPPRMYEVFSTLSNSVAANLMDLAKLNQTITDYQVKETDENLRVATLDARQKQIANQPNNCQVPQSVNVQNNTYNFTSNEMLNMLKQLNLTKEVTNVEDLPKFDLH